MNRVKNTYQDLYSCFEQIELNKKYSKTIFFVSQAIASQKYLITSQSELYTLLIKWCNENNLIYKSSKRKKGKSVFELIKNN